MLLVDPICKRVIRSLRKLTFKPGKAETMDDDYSHIADAIASTAIGMSKGLTTGGVYESPAKGMKKNRCFRTGFARAVWFW